jgi:hypothetical protein
MGCAPGNSERIGVSEAALTGDDAIAAKWNDLGGAQGVLGDYASQTTCNTVYVGGRPERICSVGRVPSVAVGPNAVGLMQQFKNGQIYWSRDTGAHDIWGDILTKYLAIGGANPGGFSFGFPVTDLIGSPDGVGFLNHFENGSIYWSPNTGAHEVHGLFRSEWQSLAWERGYLGYPASDDITAGDGSGHFQTFQNGWLSWSPGQQVTLHDTTPPETRTWSSGLMTSKDQNTPTAAADGWAYFGVASLGEWSFQGHVHDSGAIPYNYALAVTLSWTDWRGMHETTLHQGNVHGLDPGSRDDDFTISGNDPEIAAFWPDIKSSGATFSLQVSIDAGGVALASLEALSLQVASVPAAGMAILPVAILSVTGTLAGTDAWECHLQTDNPQTGEPGGFKCH